MKMLLLHADYIRYRPVRKAIRNAKEVEKEWKEFKDVLVVFTSVERSDEKNLELAIKNGVKGIVKKLEEIKVKSVLLYPYAHLSPYLASPDVAEKVIEGMKSLLRKDGFEVNSSPFGWYKEFEIKVKGHPLAESYKEVHTEAEEETIEEKTKKIPSRFVVLTPGGKEYELDVNRIEEARYLDNYPLLKSFVYSEEVKGQPSKKPPSIDAMRKLELVDYEPASEPGMFRFYPNGTLIKDLLEDFAYDVIVKEFKAMKIDTPILYNYDEPDIKAQALAFRERDYRIETPKKTLILRFAGDFGLFRMMKDTIISYKHLPLRVYEISPSFRKERRSELVGLRRCSFFHMPDLHSFCKDIEQAKQEFEMIFKKYTEILNAMKIDFALCFRIVESYYEELKPMLLRLLKHANKPALIELLGEAKHYWICKSEHQAIDSVGGNAQLSTVQLDVEDSERYGILYVDRDGRKKGCIIVHTSLGSIERLIYAILETALKAKRNPTLPLWLSPTQVRIIPLSEKYVNESVKLAKKLEVEKIRVDIDDRPESVPKKVRDAELDWVPFSVVFGPKEMKSGKLRVRIRETGKVVVMELNELVKIIKEKTEGMPFRPLTLPKLLSKRPTFVAWTS